MQKICPWQSTPAAAGRVNIPPRPGKEDLGRAPRVSTARNIKGAKSCLHDSL